MTTEELLQAIEREMVVTTARRAARHVRTLQADVERLTAELIALRQRVPVACGVPTDIGMYFYDREEFGWYPCEVIRTSNGVLLGMMGGIARNIATMKRRWATCPPPTGDKGG